MNTPGFLIHSPAKINLSLDILNRLNNRYHKIDMVLQPISLRDSILLTKNSKKKLNINTKLEIDKEKNLLQKVFDYINKIHPLSGYDLQLQKIIPVESGLGGGSSNASALLKAMILVDEIEVLKFPSYEVVFDIRKLKNICKKELKEGLLLCNQKIDTIKDAEKNTFKLPNFSLLSIIKNKDVYKKFCHDIAINISCDSVFFLENSLSRVSKMGDIIRKIKSPIHFYTVIIKPSFSMSTASAYKNFDLSKRTYGTTKKLERTLKQNDIRSALKFMKNDLEQVCIEKHKEIIDIKNALLEKEAIFSMLSGSGSAVFGIYNDLKQAKNSFDYFSSKYPFVCLCESI